MRDIRISVGGIRIFKAPEVSADKYENHQLRSLVLKVCPPPSSILWPHLLPIELETLGVRLSSLRFKKSSRCFRCVLILVDQSLKGMGHMRAEQMLVLWF